MMPRNEDGFGTLDARLVEAGLKKPGDNSSVVSSAFRFKGVHGSNHVDIIEGKIEAVHLSEDRLYLYVNAPYIDGLKLVCLEHSPNCWEGDDKAGPWPDYPLMNNYHWRAIVDLETPTHWTRRIHELGYPEIIKRMPGYIFGEFVLVV